MSLLRTLGVLSRSRFPQNIPMVAVVTPPPLSPSLRGTFVEKRHYHLSQSINSSHQEETFDVLQSLESQTHFGVAELESLQNQFVRKAGEDGVIDRSEFSDIMKGLGITDTMLVDRTFAAFDKDSSGDVDFREFVSGLSIITRGTSGDKFEFLFNLWDSNHDSFLSREEFVQFLSTSQNVETLGDEMISNIWSGLDVSEDGLVSLSEAKRGVAKLQVSCRAFSIDDDLNHANLSVEERDVAALLGRRVPLVKGTNIISQGELKTKFYILSEGSVTIQRNGIEIEKVVEGGLFGCEALLASEYGVTAVASSDVVILSINFSDMYPLVAHDHKGASRLSHRAGSTLMKLYSAISTIGATHTSISKDVDFILYKERIMQKVALFYHSVGKNGKLEIQATKGVGSPQDLSVAYSPGVAEPCLAIKDDPDKAYDYTSKGHLVGVVSNGTAVLGLGNIGALASKPVMEGKAVLFKTFGGLDSFDIELDQPDPEKFIEACVALAPTFGGINIEDVKAPECFYIEPEVQRRVNIPIMHDDAHGTAIIGGAGLLNALKVVKKDIGDIKVVVCGTGAAGFTSAKYFVSLGVKKENLIGVDKDGVIYHGRPDLDGDNAYLKVIASDSPLRTLQEVVVGADVFLGVSLGNILTPEMLLTMNKDPIVFALANPTPEINYTVAKQTRNDVIVASGRSDYPNQINNVVAFPYIFRGAIDVRSRAINEEMKKAATAAIAAIAESDSKRFGREYLIPGPGDPRLKIEVSAAVAQAAFDSGVAGRKSFDVQKYRRKLADEE